MRVFKRIKWAYLLVSVFFIALGVLLVLRPDTSMIYFCRFLGGVAVLFGLARIIGYFVRELDGVGLRYDFATGAFAIVAGAFMLWRAPEVGGVMDVWWITLLFTCVSLVLALLLIFDTFKGQQVLSIMMGVALVADGLQNLCTVIYATIFVKDVKKKVKDAVDEATAIETTGEVVTEKPPFPADFDEAIAAAAELPAAEPVEPPAEEK